MRLILPGFGLCRPLAIQFGGRTDRHLGGPSRLRCTSVALGTNRVSLVLVRGFWERRDYKRDYTLRAPLRAIAYPAASQRGGVAEWFKAAVLKTAVLQGTVG